MFEKIIDTDSSEQTAEIFGNFDSNVAVIERAFGVEIVNRDTERALGDAIVIKGESSDAVLKAYSAIEYLKNRH